MELELCPECLEAETARRNAENAQKARDMELPALSGSEKQVAWAETLRMEFIATFDREGTNATCTREIDGRTVTLSGAEYVDTILSSKTRATWWIDNRNSLWAEKTVLAIMAEIAGQRDAKCQHQAVDEMMLRPEVQTQNGIITIKCDGKRVTAKCEARNEEFTRIVKELGYRWNPEEHSWNLAVSIPTGSAEDRAAELGSKLLADGFPLIVLDEIAREKIVTGNYEPIYPRWVTKLSSDLLLIRWERGNDSLYKEAKALPSACWNREKQGITVSPKYYKILGDFIRAYDFRVSPGAQAEMDSCKECERKALLVSPTVKTAAAPAANGTDDLMQRTGVLPDLVEDDD